MNMKKKYKHYKNNYNYLIQKIKNSKIKQSNMNYKIKSNELQKEN